MITPIIEGHSEQTSMRIIMSRVMGQTGEYAGIGRPHRVRRDGIIKPGELEKRIDLILSTTPGTEAILLIMDADDDCPRDCGGELRTRGEQQMGDRGYFGVVLANRELEAWFLADVVGLSEGIDGAPFVEVPDDVEGVRDAKGLLGRALGRSYASSVDQPKFAAKFNLQRAADRCRSFRKLQAELHRALPTA